MFRQGHGTLYKRLRNILTYLFTYLNKGQGHSFWYQSISHMWLPIGCQCSMLSLL